MHGELSATVTPERRHDSRRVGRAVMLLDEGP